MPNYVINRVIINGNADIIKRIKDEVFTFDKSELTKLKDKIAGKIPFGKWETKESLQANIDFLEKQPDSCFTNVFDFDKIVPMPKDITRDDIGYEERMQNENNWYDWSIKNWGTKWNSIESQLIEESDTCLEYHFETAWSCPVPVIEALSKKYGVEVVCSFYDEDLGSNCGKFIYNNGSMKYEDYYPVKGYDFIADEFGKDLLHGYVRDNATGEWHHENNDEDDTLEK